MLLAQQSLDEAASDFEQGHAVEAGQKLEAFLKDHPDDLRALVLEGAVLDSLRHYSEAERYHQRALKLAPDSPQVLNNAANHYLASGDRRRARALYLKTIAADPRHINANLQLAQMCVEDRRGAEALSYLHRLDSSTNADAGVLMLRARALALAARCPDAADLLNKLESAPGAGAGVFFSTGMAFAECKDYKHAETSFSRALDSDPTNFDVLYNLGRAAFDAGDSGRAVATLETASKERPDDVDCLYALSQAYLKQKRTVDAASLLAKAQKLAPRRPDVLLLLAQVTASLQFFADAVTTYDQYLKLKPADDVARRERSFTLACANQFKTALPGLETYVRKYPRDARGFYELAVAQTFDDQAKALQSLNRALELDPGLSEARYGRALLNFEADKPAASVDDLRIFLEHQPNDARALANLGKAYLALNRPGDAAAVLLRALDLAPKDPMALVQYRKALLALGRNQEAQLILSRLKQAGSSDRGLRPHAGLLDYLSLPPADQHARYIENLRRNAAANPGDVQWQIRLGKELLADGNAAEALDTFRKIKGLSQDPQVLAGCGRILLDFNQYDLSRDFLELALAADSSLSVARLDLATVRFHLQSPQMALAELDKTPAAGRQGDYYLLRAQILDSLGKVQEAADALNRGIAASPTRSILYLQGAGFLLKHKLYEKALDLLRQASNLLPDDRDLQLAQAVTLAVIPRDDDAQKLLKKMQERWPEWDRPYLLNGMILEIQLKSAQALPQIETAIALGANTPAAFYYQALAITHVRPDDVESAYAAIQRALALTSNDPYICLLAGKILLARKENAAAIRELTQAVRLLPTLIPAHYALRDAYKADGDEQKSAAEIQTIQRIADQNAASDKSPFPVEDFVFSVQPPG